MNRDLSKQSLNSAGRSPRLIGDQSVFYKELPQTVETLDVEIPKGLRTFCSPRIAGQQRHSSFRVTTRTYNVTVEPNGRSPRPKEIIRESLREPDESDHFAHAASERCKAGDEPVDEFIDHRIERSYFRRVRHKRFVQGRFPVLVSPRLVPSWRLSAVGQMSMARERELEESSALCSSSLGQRASPRNETQDNRSTLTKPTMSCAMKHQDKRSGTEALVPWFAGGSATARELICDRKPVLHVDKYDAPRQWHRDSDHESVSRTSESITLPSSTSIKTSFDAERPHLESHIAAMRERGRVFNEVLKDRYEASRKNFQKERAETFKRCGGMSSFEKSCKEKDAEILRQQAVRTKAREHEPKEESAFKGLGLAKGALTDLSGGGGASSAQALSRLSPRKTLVAGALAAES